MPLSGVIEDSVPVVTKREPRQCLINKGVSEYALSVIKRCFDAGVISDSSFSVEAEDTASGDEVYKRVPERECELALCLRCCAGIRRVCR